MAKCAICDKGAHFGIKVSHSHRRSNKMWKPNVKSVKVKVNGGAKKMYVAGRIWHLPYASFFFVWKNPLRILSFTCKTD